MDLPHDMIQYSRASVTVGRVRDSEDRPAARIIVSLFSLPLTESKTSQMAGGEV